MGCTKGKTHRKWTKEDKLRIVHLHLDEHVSIKRIENMLDKMDERFDRESAARQSVEIKLAEVDQRARSAHARLDEITKILAERNN